ncbi:GNAT family N-acetyltransferase [Paenibacillus puerhi]|uniref:GNAT family N-acetyltransferase n=1 Tax=Paenibacillus puerhi TaxID=2692622 RepID=UPI00135865BE|nr:GNAT family N-acetyltransferase [Paenibacillus puerhi]
MKIDFAIESDYEFILTRDKHINKALIQSKINANEIFIIRESGKEIGWMRYGFFWDNTPFMNMIWIDERYRGAGIGKQVVLYWEKLMKLKGFELVMTSTLSNEEAQHFYRKLGYRDAGCLLLENEPMELILIKNLNNVVK